MGAFLIVSHRAGKARYLRSNALNPTHFSAPLQSEI